MATTQKVVIVTGASGFIGTAVSKRLAKEFRVIGFDKKEPTEEIPGTEFVRTDLTSDASVRDSIEHVRYKYGDWITSLIYLAAHGELSEEPNQARVQSAVQDVDRLLHDLRRFRVEQFVFASTTLVYAPTQPGHPITETSPVAPKWDFLKSRINITRLIRERRGDMQTAVLRIAGVYDDQCHSAHLAPQIQRIFERKLMSRVYPGDTSHGQVSIHLDDLVDAVERVVDRRWTLPSELTLNLGESVTLSYQELQTEFGRMIHKEAWRTNEITKSAALAGTWFDDELASNEQPFIRPELIDSVDDHYELNISRARVLLDWQPQRSLGETLPRMVSALLTDPVGWYRANNLECPPWLEEYSNSSAENAQTCSA